MSDLGFNLIDASPCLTGPSRYHAIIWLLSPNREIIRLQKDLGKKLIEPGDHDTRIGRVRDTIADKQRLALIGFSVVALCENRSHGAEQRLEGQGSYALTGSRLNTIAVQPCSLETSDGIGQAEALDPAIGRLHNVVDLPATRREKLASPASAVAMAVASQIGNPAFIALRDGLTTQISRQQFIS